MAQTVVVALCIAAAVAAAASVPSASASDQTTAMHLLPVEATEVLTKGRAGGVAIQKELTGGIQRELLDESWVRDADEARSGVAGIQSQRELLGESWVGGAERPGPGSPASRPRGNSPPPTPSQPLPRNCSQWEQRKSRPRAGPAASPSRRNSPALMCPQHEPQLFGRSSCSSDHDIILCNVRRRVHCLCLCVPHVD